MYEPIPHFDKVAEMQKLLNRFAAAARALKDLEVLLFYNKSEMLDREAFRPLSRTMKNNITIVPESREKNYDLVRRIIRAYHLAQDEREDTESFWSGHFGGRKQHVHDILMSGDIEAVATVLSDPYSNNLLFGFEGLGFPSIPNHLQDEKLGRYIYDNLSRLAEAIGATRLEYAEAALDLHRPALDIESLLSVINEKIGFVAQFPNPFALERGIQSSAGIISHRAIQALFQAKIINNYNKNKGSIVEIGAGLGRTAYYAAKFGAEDYTIIDLPLTNVAQAYFLGNVIGPDQVSLYGEPDAPFKILPQQCFHRREKSYSVALNADSLTEMSRKTAESYIREISKRAQVFISINHEMNAFTAEEILRESSFSQIDRSPYWLRQGYVQEVVFFNSP